MQVSAPSLHTSVQRAACTSAAAPWREPGPARWGTVPSRAGHTSPGPDPSGLSAASCAGSSPPPLQTPACGWPSPAEASSGTHPPVFEEHNMDLYCYRLFRF